MNMRDLLPISATFSKSPCFFGIGFEPSSLLAGNGCRVLGNDGVWRTDFISALGANLLGYGHPEFCERVAKQVYQGIGFSLPHHLEQEVAEKLADLLGSHIPGWQPDDIGIRYVLSGSDACTAAVRLARKITGRRRVLQVGYHGFHAWAVSTTPPAWGVTHPQYVQAVPFGDIDGLANALHPTLSIEPLIEDPVAAVIIEQPPQSTPDGYWTAVRRLCTDHGALLIVDEVVTAFRWALGGASERLGIHPDLICLAKALGNTVPIGCIAGPREHFHHFEPPSPVFISSTGFGCTLGLAAASAVLDIWNQSCVDHLWQIGEALMTGLRALGIEVVGYPPVFLTKWPTEEERAYFIKRMAESGILANRPWIVNLAHTSADVQETIKVAGRIKAEMQTVDVVGLVRDRLIVVLFANR